MSKTKSKSFKRKSVSAKTEGQRTYIKAIQNNDIVICQGYAGTGKTHIAIGLAIHALEKKQVEKIVIARPVVEAGENLGFLPGTEQDKMGPYVRPIMDELLYYSSHNEIASLKNSNELEICPLAFMRGRTFNNSFIICDECQNATDKQLEMLITRIGVNSKMVMTGDVTQSDLLNREQGAFAKAVRIYDGSIPERVSVIKLGTEDIVRNPLVGDLIKIWRDEKREADKVLAQS